MRRPAPRSMAPVELDGPRRAQHPVVSVVHGDPITHLPSGTAGTVERFANRDLQLRDGRGRVHTFALRAGDFSVGGVRCLPAQGRRSTPAAPVTTASGSITMGPQRARVARAGRILVEGVHDAELVEKIWGDDLRHEGVVVERLDGMDHLDAVVAEFGPGPHRRLGVLLDHLVSGSKESRAAAALDDPWVLVTGTPYVDIWQAIRPSVAGIDSWPEVPHGEEWKQGVLRRLGRSDLHPGEFWRELLGRVRSYADLFPPLVGAVEELIDFVTEDPADT